ncbi:MAG: RNA pseudouridine synthase, partial [Erysipelotrichaceae bacterium]|nr:RNA pseudouridine synthase [Erysipelotrichaceae bacterium]
HKPGNVYLGLLHRLDRPVDGVCVFAKTSKAASRLSKQITEGSFHKEYLAVVKDDGLADSGTLKDRLLKDHKTNTVRVDRNGKESSLYYEVLKRKDGLALVRIELHTGRSHQIRVQFSSRGHALYGDQRYNKDARAGQQIALHAYKLTFEHPVTKETMTFVSATDRYPFGSL